MDITVHAGIGMIEERIAPLRNRLVTHPLYRAMKNERDVTIFMESHVFAVWDFMSLLKSLQGRLTSVSVPWIPSASPESRRFINEIVLGEESDLYEGRAVSHFELYLEAMQEVGADTAAIQAVLASSPNLELVAAPECARTFVEETMHLIATGSIAAQAAAFTFGREDVIPDMFRELVRDLNHRHAGRWTKFIWYLERHIAVDAEDHGPLSLRMVADLCGTDDALWEEAATAAHRAIAVRLHLWDGILQKLA